MLHVLRWKGEDDTVDNIAKGLSIPNYVEELLGASGRGLHALTDAFANILGLRILVTTPAYEFLSASFPHQDLHSFHVERAGASGDNETLFFGRLSAGTLQSKVAGRAIAPAGRVLGYLLILCDERESEIEGFISIINTGASLYAVHLQSRMELLKEQYKYKESFLYDLIYGNLKKEEEIIATGATWGWNFELPHTIVLLVIPELELHSPNHHLMDILSRITGQALIKKYHKQATMVRYNELIVFLPTEADKQPELKQVILAFTDSFFGRLKGTELESRVVCGVGQTYIRAIDLFRSYQEAKVSLELGIILGINVSFFSDTGVERIFYKHDHEDLKEYYTHVLGELHKQDNEGLALLSVLESFAENQFEVTKTAEALFLHRNTLRYRLNKIEAIMGRSLNDNNTRFDIMAALKIKRLHRMDEEL